MADHDFYDEAIKNLTKKSELEQTIAFGLHGPPEIKSEEKRQYLGEFRERVLLTLTKAQVMRSAIFPEILEALKDSRSTKMLIYGDIPYRFRNKYQKLATSMGKPFTVIHDPDLKGPIGLVIASDHAVEQEQIQVQD